MLALQPTTVTLLGRTLDNVEAVAVHRRASKAVVEHGDGGPHAVFADCPEQRVTVTIARLLAGPEPPGPAPGSQGALEFTARPSAGQPAGRRYAATVVITAVEIDLPGPRGARQRIECVALSPDGATDPLADTEAPA